MQEKRFEIAFQHIALIFGDKSKQTLGKTRDIRSVFRKTDILFVLRCLTSPRKERASYINFQGSQTFNCILKFYFKTDNMFPFRLF